MRVFLAKEIHSSRFLQALYVSSLIYLALPLFIFFVGYLDWLPGLVEVVRTACQAQSKDPFQRRGDGIDTLCDHLAHHIDRIVLVLRGAYAELEPSTQAQHP